MRFFITLLLITGLLAPAFAQSVDQIQDTRSNDVNPSDDILNMDLEQLSRAPVVVPSMDIQVTSVTKEQSTVGRSAAAVFVITNEMIRRSGATCIPEALRMAPGLDVAHINSNTWAISARGFNGMYARQLLVLIDGRSVYTPVSSGVYWDVQDVLLEDVDRIEVIRGPGGTLWGANAVNGVINVITKKAADTQGAYVEAGGGTVERSFESARYGGRIGETGYYRVYGKYFDRSPFYDPTGPAPDGWNQGRFGFRTDLDLDRAKDYSLTVQGDHYVGIDGMSAGFTSLTPPYYEVRDGQIHNSGENVLARLTRTYDEDSNWTLQTYFDQFARETILNSEIVRTFDIEFQYRFKLSERHKMTCGAGYRYINEECPSEDPFTASIQPPIQNTFVANQFIQDEISLVPERLDLIVGCKIEQNGYTGFEYEPNIRLLWTPDRKHTFWGAVSRAVRTPAVFERSLFSTAAPTTTTPYFLRILGNQNSVSTTLFAYELGYRTQATDRFSYDIATFYNVYDRLTSTGVIGFQPFPDPTLILQFNNNAFANSYGVELATNFTVSENWRLSAQYTFFRVFEYDNALETENTNSPKHQAGLRSSWNLREDLDFDLTLRYVDCLVSLDVPSYTEMDLRLAWRPRKQLELAVVGQNLLQAHHWEFGDLGEYAGYAVTEVPRGVYGTISWRR
ncbi:MAG: TonB-dependent receptor [Pirellulales bacterium]|nr:TonB-dependent receptor [Pirellulales bacterium]